MTMNLQKVVYHKGDNAEYDYFILKQKDDIKIDKESLAYQFDKTDDHASIINEASVQGNFDMLLETRLKTGEIRGTVLCNFEDVDLV